MNYGSEKSNIQEVKIASSGSTSLLALGVILSLGFNAYTLFRVAELTSLITDFINQIKPILIG